MEDYAAVFMQKPQRLTQLRETERWGGALHPQSSPLKGGLGTWGTIHPAREKFKSQLGEDC
jgi:hypothetical protein